MNRVRWGLIVAMLAVGLLPLARGGNLSWAEALFGVTVGAALLLTLGGGGRPRPLPPASRLALGLWFLWLGWLVLQWSPLPPSLAAAIAPASAQFWSDARQLGLQAPSRITLDVTESARHIFLSVALLALYLTVRNAARHHRSNVLIVLGAILIAGTLQALYGVTAQLTDFAVPLLEPAPPVHALHAHGTFPNRNHFAAFLVPAFACGLALILAGALRERRQWQTASRRLLELVNSPAITIRVCMVGLVIGIVLSASRMGNVAFLGGLAAFAFAWSRHHTDRRALAKAAALFLSIVIIDVAIISQQFGLERVVERLAETELSTDTRAAAREMAVELVQRHGLAGAGAGSFRVLEDGVRPDMQLGYWHHAHNDHLELMVEFGVFGYALLSMLLLCHVVLAWQALSSRSTLHRSVGALVIMVITAASIHALVEFVFHTPALRAVYVALLGLVAGLPQQRRAIDSKRVLVAETNDGGRE